MSKRVAFAVIMLCLILTLSGCEAGVPKTRKVLPEWSRGQQLGVAALNQLIDLVPEDNFVHLVWVAAEVNVPHYVRLDPSGQIELSRDLDIVGAHPNDARLALNADDSLSILWTDNPKIPRALFLARMSRDGHLLSGPTQLSPEGAHVSRYALVTDLDGNHHVFWANEIPSEGGIHHLQLSPEGQVASSSRLLIQNASQYHVVNYWNDSSQAPACIQNWGNMELRQWSTLHVSWVFSRQETTEILGSSPLSMRLATSGKQMIFCDVIPVTTAQLRAVKCGLPRKEIMPRSDCPQVK